MKGQFRPVYCSTSTQPADMNTKPHGGASLRKMTLDIVGFQYFLPLDSEHFRHLDLDKYLLSNDWTSQQNI